MDEYKACNEIFKYFSACLYIYIQNRHYETAGSEKGFSTVNEMVGVCLKLFRCFIAHICDQAVFHFL